MRTRTISLFAFAAFLISPLAWGQVVRQGTFEISPFAGYLFGGSFARGTTALFDTRVDVADHFTYGGSVGYNITSKFELEAHWSRSETSFVTDVHDNSGGLFSGSGRQRLGGLDIDYYLGYVTFNFGHERAVPYISVGAGAARLDPRVAGTSAETETRFTGSLGAGLKMFFTPNVGLRFGGRYYGTSLPDSGHRSCDRHFDSCENRDWLSNGDVTGGLLFAF